MHENCQACLMHQPNLAAAPKAPVAWIWPADYECAAGCEGFPKIGANCGWFIREQRATDDQQRTTVHESR